MKGKSGNEKVEFYKTSADGGGKLGAAKLSTAWQTFSYYAKNGIRMHSDDDEDGDGDVIVKNTRLYRIQHNGFWNKWNCGKENANERCGWVQEGKFSWPGNYMIRLKGMIRIKL